MLKVNRVLQLILLSFLLIVLRVWHLGVIQREEKIKEAEKPQQRSILLRADRGTICDRFHIPLALNRICYNAAIYYGQIAQVPVVSWSEDEKGRKIRVSPRVEYIRKLSEVLAETLALDAERIEDLIHSKASLFPHIPTIIKANLAESEYYRLKALERDWLGVHAEIAAERFYPLGKVASHLIGTMGAISQKQYEALAEETVVLQEAIAHYEQGMESDLPLGYASIEEIYQRLFELQEKSYTLNDLVGKSGIEGQFEEKLRGYWGKKTFEVDQKGRFVRELPGSRAPLPGRQIVLSISAELQQFAEELLIQSEKEREGRSIGIDPADKVRKIQKQPWIKGGAIVALDPKTGEVLALASYPRFDPNDFIPSKNAILRRGKQRRICKWLENERLLAAIWDGRDSLIRELLRGEEESVPLTWDFFLDQILPQESALRLFFQKVDDIQSAIAVQEDFEALLYFSGIKDPLALLEALFSQTLRIPPEASQHQRRLESLLSSIPSHADKLFAIDLCRLAVDSSRFTEALLTCTGLMKLSTYHSLSQEFQRWDEEMRQRAQEEFHREEFRKWRDEHQREFLVEKRKEEKEKKSFARPYLDYLDQKEKELFAHYWEGKRLSAIKKALFQNRTVGVPPDLEEEFLRTFRSFQQLDRPLYGHYRALRHRASFIIPTGMMNEARHDCQQTEKDLAAAFYPVGGFGFSRSFAFQSSAPQGSLFKLVTGYEALRQGAALTLVDEGGHDALVAYSQKGVPYPRIYKGGRLPRSSLSQIGHVDLIGAIEQSSNPYFAILAGDYLSAPDDLAAAARRFGFGEKTGLDLLGEVAGKVPTDLMTNRTGLYSFAIGQHTFLSTPLQTALMLAALANGGNILKPRLALQEIGIACDREPLAAFSQENRFAKRELAALGIHFPLFTGVESRLPISLSQQSGVEVKRSLVLPSSIRSQLFEGMDRSIWSAKGTARPTTIRSLLANPLLMSDYLSLQHQMIGKTSTAELLANLNANPSSRAQTYKHIWFGAISFDPIVSSKARWDHPELVVVVFLRYGDAGKEGAPLVARLIRKWREIKRDHDSSSS